MTIINKQTEYAPIKKINDNNVVVMWDYKPIMKQNSKGDEIITPLASWQEKRFSYLPTFDEIKNLITDYYNCQINEEILCGFVWNGMQIWLTNENQFNYKAAYDLAVQTNGATLPVKFKFGDNSNAVYYVFTNLETLSDFYVKAIEHIKSALEKGWQKKDSINWDVYKF